MAGWAECDLHLVLVVALAQAFSILEEAAFLPAGAGAGEELLELLVKCVERVKDDVGVRGTILVAGVSA